MTDEGSGSSGARTGDRWAVAIAETVALAFRDDPTWSPVVESNAADPTAARRYWEFFVRSAQRFPWTGAAGEAAVDGVEVDGAEDGGPGGGAPAAVSVWLPPGADELTEAEERRFPELATELFGRAKAEELFRIVERFDAARPSGDFFYLSLLATHSARRGEGLGMGLLRDDLRRIDALERPSYLESSNPANDERYRRLGYRGHGTIVLPSGLELTTMWRDPEPPR